MSVAADLGEIAFSPGAEEWIEYGPPGDRRRVAFHDYATLYGVPGLYERIFRDALGMRSDIEVVGLYADALGRLGRDPAAERVLDLGAGSGVGGERLREAGVGAVFGLDREPAAADAIERDRPGVYDDMTIADLEAAPGTFETLRAHDLTGVVAVSAIGIGHISLELLTETFRRLLRPGGLVAFAVNQVHLPGFLDDFAARLDSEELGRHDYVHRREADGSPHEATAVVARLR